MKKRPGLFFVQTAILVLVLVAVFFLSRTVNRGTYDTVAGFAQGTTYHITYSSKNQEDLKPLIDSLLDSFNLSLSIYNNRSVISRFNRNDPGVKADDMFTEVFRKSEEVNRITGGAFDITVAPIVNALGFGSSKDTMNVDSAMIDSLLQYVGMAKVSLKDGRILKQNPHVMLDVNALAQGYSVDIVCRFLESRGIRNYLVEIGGEIRARGKNPSGQAWNVGIDKPEEGNVVPGAELQTVIRLKNRSLATSGNYRKYYERNGVKYVHTIDPKTGHPVISNLLSATVVARDCMTADAYATALMVFGLDRSIAFLKEHSFLEAYLVYADEKGQFRVYCTPGLQKFLEE
jgi:FAD:protein FMN transferase